MYCGVKELRFCDNYITPNFLYEYSKQNVFCNLEPEITYVT